MDGRWICYAISSPVLSSSLWIVVCPHMSCHKAVPICQLSSNPAFQTVSNIYMLALIRIFVVPFALFFRCYIRVFDQAQIMRLSGSSLTIVVIVVVTFVVVVVTPLLLLLYCCCSSYFSH